MKEAWVGCDGCCFCCSGSWKREGETAKARFAVVERAREVYFCGVRSWRRVCWRRVRMHDVQTVEEDIVCELCWCEGLEEEDVGGEIDFFLLANSLDGQVQWKARMNDLTNFEVRSVCIQSECVQADFSRVY